MAEAKYRLRRIVLLAAVVPFALLSGCDWLQRFGGWEEAPRAAGVLSDDGRTYRLPPFIFVADFSLAEHTGLLASMADLQTRLQNDLKLPEGDAPITVRLFRDVASYKEFMRETYPGQPPRRAFFVCRPPRDGAPIELTVYTWWSERVEQDIRHELTHALLHRVLRHVPLWLDEGLAEYYEAPPRSDGLHPQHSRDLADSAKDFQPDLQRLQTLKRVQQMHVAEYREAWAWVHFLLHHDERTKQMLLAYLQDLRNDEAPRKDLGQRLRERFPNPEQELRRHIMEIAAGSSSSAR